MSFETFIINNELLFIFLTVFGKAISKQIGLEMGILSRILIFSCNWLPCETLDIGKSKKFIIPLRPSIKGIYSPNGTRCIFLYASLYLGL